jgi:hypothetical protein
MDNDGNVKFYLKLSGTHPHFEATEAPNQDRCMGLSVNGLVTALLQVKMKEIRYFSPGNFYDTTLMMFDSSGTIEKAVSISNANLQYDMYSSSNGIFQINGEPYFAGWSYGFATRSQSYTKEGESPDYDLYVYHY